MNAATNSRHRGRGSVPVPLRLDNPLVFSGSNPNAVTVAVGLSQLVSSEQVHLGVLWNIDMAASVLFMLPVITLFFLAQRAFIEGVTLTGVKG